MTFLASLPVGAADIDPGTVVEAFVAFDGSREHLIVRNVRVPRALVATFVGASLGVAGAIAQGLTRNPLAAPGILGINAGAALLVVGAILLLPVTSLAVYVWFAFLGAGLAAAIVFLLASFGHGGLTPMKIVVVGAALTVLLSSLTQGLLVLHERTLDEIRFWLAGSVAGRDLGIFFQVLPYMLLGLTGALALGKQLNTLSLGEDVAKGLGQRTGRVKAAAVGLIILLAGSSVAVAGPIGFLGLAVPHLARRLVGLDYRWVLPYAAILGATLLLLGDVAARVVLAPEELPVGVMTAVLGAPVFVVLVHQGARRV
ncbi:MAG: iron chelate uptake ABC transporter family permease subunit [Chloroflexi bacterium]|nr:iron chelate uptake ABC transporter family permease subunit [Chloroflexota bacterium]